MNTAEVPAENGIAEFVKRCGSKRLAAKLSGIPRGTLRRWLKDIERTGDIIASKKRKESANRSLWAAQFIEDGRRLMHCDVPGADSADALMGIFGYHRAGRGDDMQSASFPGSLSDATGKVTGQKHGQGFQKTPENGNDFAKMNGTKSGTRTRTNDRVVLGGGDGLMPTPGEFATSAFATTQGTNVETVELLMGESVHGSRIADGKARKPNTSKRIVVVSDLHCGHMVGLTPPGWWYSEHEELQREMWEWYEGEMETIGEVDACFVVGDTIDGKGSRSGGVEQLTNDLIAQTDMATACLKIIQTDKYFMVHGCVTAGHKILMGDLSYKNVEDVVPGETLMAFDEHPYARSGWRGARRWKLSKVIKNDKAVAPVYRITLSDGKTITATGDHPFFTAHQGKNASAWFIVKQMMKWERPFLFKRALPVWDRSESYKAGYLAGFLDGEGSLSQRVKTYPDGAKTCHFTLHGYQNDNECLDYAKQCLDEFGFKYSVGNYEKGKPCNAVQILGGFPEVLRAIGTVMPKRLFSKIDFDSLPTVKRVNCGNDDVYVVDISPCGDDVIYELSTSTKTYVVDGFLSHNTPYHVGPDGEHMERLVARNLGGTISGHEWIDVNGCVFDLKHKIGSSGVSYGRHTAVAKEKLWNTLWNLRKMAPKANVILRGHVHYYLDCGGIGWRAMTLPALQGPGSFYGVEQCSGIVDFGFVVFDVDADGKFKWEVHEYNPTIGQPVARVL